MNGKKILSAVLCLVLVLSMLSACGTPANNTPANTTPDNTNSVPQSGVKDFKDLNLPPYIAISTYDVGSATFGQIAGVCEGVLKTTGITTRQIVGSTDKARLTPVRAGTLHIVAGSGNMVALASIGRAPFNTSDWGPQNLRQLWSTPAAAGQGCYVMDDSSIKDWADLKGKKVTFIPGNDSANISVEAILAYAGLTWADVEQVNCSSPTDAYNAFAEGRADCMIGGTNTGSLQETAQTKKVRMIEPDPSNAAGIERMKDVNPALSIGTSTICVGYEGQEKHVFAFCAPVFMSYPNLSNDVAYAFTHAMDISYDEFKTYSKDLVYYDRAHAVNVDTMVVPFHEGAVQYLKDVGAWTPELQARQDELLAKEKKYMDAWEKCLMDFSTSGKKADQFSAFWDAIRDGIK